MAEDEGTHHSCRKNLPPIISDRWVDGPRGGPPRLEVVKEYKNGEVVNCPECGRAWVVKPSDYGHFWVRLRWWHRTRRERLEL